MTLKRDSHPELFTRLLPLFGGADKRPRILDKDVMAIGRARGCDITLDANEVSAIHCLFYRGVSGYRIRDCGSRTGTRLNGSAVKNSQLADGDVLQIGPFSFEVKLQPLAAAAPTIAPQQMERAHQSRRNLVRMALQLRRRLRQSSAGNGALGEKASQLKAKIHHFDQRAGQLEQSELELVAERTQLTQEKESHSRHVQQVETDLTRRLTQTDKEIHDRWTEFQKRCAAEDARLHAPGTTATVQVTGDTTQAESQQRDLAERERRLKEREAAWERREREAQEDLEEIERQQQQFARQRAQGDVEVARQQAELQKQKNIVDLAEKSLRDQKAELARMFQDIKRMQDEIRQQPRPDNKPLQQENQQLKQKVSELEKKSSEETHRLRNELAAQEKFRLAQCEELQLLRDQLAQPVPAPTVADPAVAAELARVQGENDQLRHLLQQQLFKPAKGNDDELRAENEQLRLILTEYEQRMASEQTAPTSGDAKRLREENDLLRQLLQEKDKFVEEVRSAPHGANGELPLGVREQLESQEMEVQRLTEVVAKLELQLQQEQDQQPPALGSPSLDDMDLDSLEAELNRERRQIAAERAKLNKEIETLRARNAELDEATRELEMGLSRERADMARERMRLDRMREEIKNEMERLQRDGGVRESLASVQRLREQMKATGPRR